MPLCTQRLGVMHAGGIKVVVVPGWGATLTSLMEYAATAHALGMSVMWELSNPGWWREPPTSTDMARYFPAFATGCGCTENGPVLSYMIGWLGALSGTYGYYAADDSMLSAGDRAGVAAYVSQIKQRDPSHTVLIGSFGLGQSQKYEGIADMIGDEIYPVTTTSLLPKRTAERGTRSRRQQAGRSRPQPPLTSSPHSSSRRSRGATTSTTAPPSAPALRAKATWPATPHCNTRAQARSWSCATRSSCTRTRS